jgi:hypothetical protein
VKKSLYPLLYQVNTRVWLTDLSAKLGRRATLDDIPDSDLDHIAEKGFDWIWFLSVWQTGSAGQKISRENEGWRHEFEQTLPDLREEDIEGSGFAIKSYTVSEEMGGDSALSRLRSRVNSRGMRLMLDFVPNHTAIDNVWVDKFPGYFIRGTEELLAAQPSNYIKLKIGTKDVILAHGRDPYFPGWPDTLQLNYGNNELREAMTGELQRIAGQCDGVRCDMAMLVLPDVFERTWGIPCQPFWPDTIRKVKEINSGFCFMAEVYWDLEWAMLQQGFDYAYDKRLYDRLKEGCARPVVEHFYAGTDFQSRMARFLENHDEPRAATEFPAAMHEAAAVITFLSPGLRFFHHGQLQGRKKRISPHLVRAPEEKVNSSLELYYERLLEILDDPLFRNGDWKLIECTPAWPGNYTNDCFISFGWKNDEGRRVLIAVNYSAQRGQCYIKLPFHDIITHKWVLKDLLSEDSYERDGYELVSKGLYLDEPGWKCYVFEMSRGIEQTQ